MKIFKSKKATEVVTDWGPWMFFVIAVGIIGIFIVKIADINIAEGARIPPDIEQELILAARFYNSDDCFAYVDDVGRVHPGVIDESKFTQETLDRCFPPSDVKYSYSLLLNLEPFDSEYTEGTRSSLTTFNWGPGFVKKVVLEDIFVIFNDEKLPGKLRINIKNVE